VTIPAAFTPSISLVKAADVASVGAQGDPINYSFVVTNTGNVTLTGVAVTDVPVGAISCPVSTLAPDASTTCTADATYFTTQPQVDAGQVANTATVSANPPSGSPVNAGDSLTVPATSTPSVSLVKSGVAVTDVPVGSVSCPVTSLAPGVSTTCTADAAYLTTQTQVDAGQVDNTATVVANPPTGPAVNALDSVTVPAISSPGISLIKSADVVSVAAEDDPIAYSFEVTNTGNVTLSSVVVTDVPVGSISCPVTSLDPGASTTCTADAAYLTTQTQVDAGQVVNTATASGTPPIGSPVNASDSLTIPVPSDAELTLTKSADVASVSAEDDPIAYSFLVTNVGNVTLTSVAVTDVPVGSVTCPVATLAPGASTTCTADADFLATQAQVDAGLVVNTASVSANPPAGPAVSATDSLTILAPAAASVSLVKSADVASVSAEDDPIAYSFVVSMPQVPRPRARLTPTSWQRRPRSTLVRL